VSRINRRLRSLLVALAVLALSAGAVLAGRTGLSAPASPIQVAGPAESAEPSESPEIEPSESPEIEPSESPETEPSEAPDTGTTSAGVHPDNHGLLVSEAAQASTPPGFDNHGQYVRTIAQANPGQAASATAKTHGKKPH